MPKYFYLYFKDNPKDKESKKGFDTLDMAIEVKKELEQEGYEVRLVKKL